MAPPESLWTRITPEELQAEDAVLLPRHLVTDEQIVALIAWLQAESARQLAEADALEAFAKQRAKRSLRVVPEA